MSWLHLPLKFAATTLRVRAPARPRNSGDPRILVIRRNRLGDMIYTLPLLHALRRHHPRAHISVACDPPGAPIAEACEAVNDVVILGAGWSRWVSAYRNAAALQTYDWVIAAKGGFDRRLAALARLTNASARVGFEAGGAGDSRYYTHPVPIPEDATDEHQADTLMRLLRPLGLVRPTTPGLNLSLRIPDASREFADDVLARAPFAGMPGFMLINFSSTVHLRFREEDFIALIRRILGVTSIPIGLVAAPLNQQLTHEIAMCMASSRVLAVDTPGPMDLAALLERAHVLITPEGGAAHLAAAMNAPALVLWSEGPFQKWRSRGKRHAYVHAQPGEAAIPLERVWEALLPFLNTKDETLQRTPGLRRESPPFGFGP